MVEGSIPYKRREKFHYTEVKDRVLSTNNYKQLFYQSLIVFRSITFKNLNFLPKPSNI